MVLVYGRCFCMVRAKLCVSMGALSDVSVIKLVL